MGKHLPIAGLFTLIASLVGATHYVQFRPRVDKSQLLLVAETSRDETRLDALRTLVNLHRNLEAPGGGIGIDHLYCVLKTATADRLVFVATLSDRPDLPGRHPWFWQPKYNTDGQDYWAMSVLEFDRSGRLLAWRPYRE